MLDFDANIEKASGYSKAIYRNIRLIKEIDNKCKSKLNL